MILLSEDYIWTFVIVVFTFPQFCRVRRFTTYVVLTIKTIVAHKHFRYLAVTSLYLGPTNALTESSSGACSRVSFLCVQMEGLVVR